MRKEMTVRNKKKASRIELWRSHTFSALTAALVWAAALLTMAVLVFLVGFIAVRGIRSLTPELFSLTYNSDNVSLMPALVNTLTITSHW